MVRLFVDDVKTGDGGVGHEALARWFDTVLRYQRVTVHFVGNHVIDLVDADHARGVVYCRPEHEVDGEWIVMPIIYSDRYERRGGRWLFRSRQIKAFYAADVTHNPLDVAGRFHFPGNEMITSATLPESWASWDAFWEGTGGGG